MRKNNKVLYEKIMRNVSREVKRALNESMYSIEDEIYEYIQSDPELYDYYEENFDGSLIPTNDIQSCVYNYEDGNIYYNPEFMDNLSTIEKVFIIFHNITHIKFNDDAKNIRGINDNIMIDKKVNNYLEFNFPQFKGLAKKLQGYI